MMVFNFDVCISIVLEEHLYFHGKEQTGCLNMSFFSSKRVEIFPKNCLVRKTKLCWFLFLNPKVLENY